MRMIHFFLFLSFMQAHAESDTSKQHLGVISALKKDVRAYRNPKDKPTPEAQSKYKQVKFKGKFFDSYPLTKQSPLYKGDVIVTLQAAHAKLILTNGDVVVLGPESSFELAATTPPAQASAGKSEPTDITLWYGKVRSIIRKTGAETAPKLQIKSPNAVIGVRGTDFYTEFDLLTKKTKVAPLHGSVEVSGAQTNAKPVLVEEGKESTVATKKNQPTAPSEPKIIQADTISSAVHVSAFKHDAATDTAETRSEPKVSEEEFKKLEASASETVKENTQHLEIEQGEDPLAASIKTYQKVLEKMYKSGPPWNERIFNWMKNSL